MEMYMKNRIMGMGMGMPSCKILWVYMSVVKSVMSVRVGVVDLSMFMFVGMVLLYQKKNTHYHEKRGGKHIPGQPVPEQKDR